jgi:colanic acid/amylovoran biosynthesis glycosyltransferase
MEKRHQYSNPRHPGRKVAYVLGRFPALHMTFVDREIQEAKRRGVNLVLVAIRPANRRETSIGIRRTVEGTKYILPVHWGKFIHANLYFILTDFLVYFSTFCYVLTRHHHSIAARIKTLFHFTEGVLASALLRSEQVDHIHAHFADGTTIVSMVASRLLRVPYSVTAHAYDIYVQPVMLREKVTNAKFVTTCTAYNKTFLENVTGCHVNLIYHGLDTAAFRPNLYLSRKNLCPLLLSVGSLKEKKGFAYLIKACLLLKNQGYNLRCEIIGNGPEQKKLEQLIVDLGLQNSVVLCGALLNREVMAKYTRATILVQASVLAEDSDRDGIPNVILEAMASGVPVVATKVSGIPEVIERGVTGLLVEPRDERDLADAIARLLDDSKLCDSLARKGRQLIEEKFDIRTNIERLIELFGM